jgi:putative heme-binding domain-containing protein
MPLRHSALRNPHSEIAFCLLSSVLCLLSPLAAQDDPFAAGVRTTPWLSPEDEQKAFKLPPGFEIQLVAAEPDIQKPLNMAFDERGRIWLTCSVEYPYAAPLDKPARDSIRVLEDTDGDGRFEKVTVFADGLNIPIGIYPYKGGCIAWSIPNIWHVEDTDADGVCDKRTVLYGPFDHTRDVHGNCNAFRRGFDGWIYACHGFNNDSHVKGRDGNEVHLNSGNTFRFKLDGSRIEHFTHGQVNPFGMCFDELFNIFTADCHSKPLTQLIRGGYYPSFGKPHEGLGFVPSMMEHSHGSTAICGVVCYSGENFPAEYRGNYLSGNVMTSRINRNMPEYHGSTIKAIEQPDFLSTTDPWFRPVDLQVGPDGALYILDFYNRIIGHYEVPLPHPGRDRTSGRIWRLVYKGDAEGTKPADKPNSFDITKLSIDQLIAQLDSPQLEHRLRVMNLLADLREKECLDAVTKAFVGNHTRRQEIHLAWLLERLDPIHDGMLTFWAADVSRDTRIHFLKMIAEREKLSDVAAMDLAFPYLEEKDGALGREAALVLGIHRRKDYLDRLVHALNECPKDDALRAHALRMAIRDCVTVLRAPNEFVADSLSNEARQRVMEICTAVPTPVAAAILIDHLRTSSESETTRLRYVAHAAKHVASENIDMLVNLARAQFTTDRSAQAQIIQAIADGLIQRGAPPNATLQSWAEEVVRKTFETSPSDAIGWTAVPVEGKPASASPWVVAPRPCQDGVNDQPFFYSLPKGEQRTGIYRSAAFELPAKLSFWCAGHSGFPDKPLNDGNYVRLRDATTHVVLAESRPPRNDTAQLIEWDLSKLIKSDADTPSPQPSPKGRGGYIELVDGDTANAYAWLAVGRFSLAGLNPSDTARRQQLAAEIVGKLKLTALRPHLATLVSAPNTDGTARAAAGQALVSLDPDSRAAALVVALNDPAMPTELRVKLGQAIAHEMDGTDVESLGEVMKLAPARLQTAIADTLAGDATGAAALLALVETGQASPRLLLSPNVSAKLGTLKDMKLDERASAATAKLPPVSETIDKLIAERLVGFARHPANLERGEAVFTKHCAACHQIAGKGTVVGPQLDGIGGRGLARIVEDVLDPNRNVDVAFRTTTIRLDDGRVLSGLFRRAEGAQLVFADNEGKEFTLAKDEISQEQKTALSLMPANVPEIVPADEFHDLMAWLLSQRTKPAE